MEVGKLFIAEIGINHNCDLNLAKKLIDMCVVAGVDYVKFQKRNPEVCVPDSEKFKLKDTPWGQMSYIDYKRKLEFSEKEYDEINSYCKSKGIKWFASVWDIDSLNFIMQYDVDFVKIPSAKITDVGLLKEIVKFKIPVIMSVGMSSEEQIDAAVNILNKCDLTILHCNSSYPAKDEELNLKYVAKLKEKYPFAKIGYSGHEEGISACIVAKTLGAEVFERHVTLSRSMWGTDQAASLVYDQLYRLVRDLKKVDVWIGDGVKKVYDSEKLVMSKLRI